MATSDSPLPVPPVPPPFDFSAPPPNVSIPPGETEIPQDEEFDYVSYTIYKQHSSDTGLRQGATYGKESVVIRLHGGAENLAVHWLAQSRFGPPEVPAPELFDRNATFLYGARNGLSPMLLPSLVAHTWKLWGTYYYALTTPVGLTSDFYLGQMPFDTIPLADTGGPDAMVPDFTMPAANFTQGLIDPNPNPPPVTKAPPPLTL